MPGRKIVPGPGCITARFVDASSHSDILVSDNNQEVSYMGSGITAARNVLQTARGMGGTTDWAIESTTPSPQTRSRRRPRPPKGFSRRASRTSRGSVLSKPSDWMAEKQAQFFSYMGQAVLEWAKVAAGTQARLLDGSPEFIKLLGNAMTDRNLIVGKPLGELEQGCNLTRGLESNIAGSFFGFSIPNLWRVSSTLLTENRSLLQLSTLHRQIEDA